MKKENRGGRRKGAGASSDGIIGMRRISITLPPDVEEFYKHIGGGNLSLGIRRARLILLDKPHA